MIRSRPFRSAALLATPMQKDFVAARRSFEQSLRHDPDYLPARMALEYLDSAIGKAL